MTTIPQPATPTSSFAATYDAWNRLISLVGVASYSYDGLNRRATKTVSGTVRDFYYSNQWQVLEERIGGASIADRQFVWGLRYIDDLVLRDRVTERLYSLQDNNWNVNAITDANGNVKERYIYSAYGLPTFLSALFAILADGGNYDWETLFAGYRLDGESGIFQVRERYLNALIGTWMSREPVRFPVGDINDYRYVINAPINAIDPTGEFVFLCVCLIGLVVLAGCKGSPEIKGKIEFEQSTDKPNKPVEVQGGVGVEFGGPKPPPKSAPPGSPVAPGKIEIEIKIPPRIEPKKK